MKVLFLTPQLPYPVVSGGVFKTYRMLDHLLKSHEVSFGCLLKGEDASYLNSFKEPLRFASFFSIELNVQRSGINFLKSLLHLLPLSVYRNKSEAFKRWVYEEANSCDVIFIDHFLMFQYVPINFKKKIVFHEHNAEYVMWERFAHEQKGLKKLLLRLEAARIKSYESMCIQRATCTFAAPNDIDELKKINPQALFHVTYHLGDDDLLNEPFIPFSRRRNQLLYIGTLTWEANKDGLNWFLEDVWPSLLSKKPDLELVVVGKRHKDDFTQWLNHPSIQWIGFVENLKPFYNKAKIFIAPLRFGSGIKVKNINAMYRGLPVVTSEVGVEGLAVKNDLHVKVCHTAEDYILGIQTLLEDEVLWNLVAIESKNFAREHFSWEVILKDIEKVVSDD